MSATPNHADKQYLRIMRGLLDHGVRRQGRNAVTFSKFGEHMRFRLYEGFPLLTTKKVHFKSIVVELLWFLRGYTTVKFLHDHGVTIWDEWADENGDLGPVYGAQWRSWPTMSETPVRDWNTKKVIPNEFEYGPGEPIDQIANVIQGLRKDPYGRRHIVTAWNPAEIDRMALPPCHCLFQFYVEPNDAGVPTWLSCHLYQRSADWFLGVPFNIASYALLTHLIAREVGLRPKEFIHSFGDLHLYENHREQALSQILRDPLSLPHIEIAGDKPLFELEPEDIKLVGYEPWPAISAQVTK